MLYGTCQKWRFVLCLFVIGSLWSFVPLPMTFFLYLSLFIDMFFVGLRLHVCTH